MSFKSIWLRPSDCAIVNYPIQTTTTLANLTFLALRMTGSGRNSSCSNRLALGLKTSSPGTVAKCNSRSDMLISAAITGSGGDSRTDSSEKSGANTIQILVKNSKTVSFPRHLKSNFFSQNLLISPPRLMIAEFYALPSGSKSWSFSAPFCGMLQPCNNLWRMSVSKVSPFEGDKNGWGKIIHMSKGLYL